MTIWLHYYQILPDDSDGQTGYFRFLSSFSASSTSPSRFCHKGTSNTYPPVGNVFYVASDDGRETVGAREVKINMFTPTLGTNYINMIVTLNLVYLMDQITQFSRL